MVNLDGEVLPHQITGAMTSPWLLSSVILASTRLRQPGVQDHPSHIQDKLLAWQGSKDIILITGGISKGKHDFIPPLLESLNVKKVFHQVAQRPGKTPLVWCLWKGAISLWIAREIQPLSDVSCTLCSPGHC